MDVPAMETCIHTAHESTSSTLTAVSMPAASAVSVSSPAFQSTLSTDSSTRTEHGVAFQHITMVMSAVRPSAQMHIASAPAITRHAAVTNPHLFSHEDIMDDFATVARKDSDSWIDEAAKDLAERDLLDLAAMPEKNPDPILEIALDGALTFCNAAARRVFPNILVEGHTHAVLRGMFALVDRLTAGVADEETRIVTAGGTMWEQRFVFHPVSRRVRVFHRDVTVLKRLERENQELKQQIDQLRMQTFHNAQTLDYELRSELSIILGYSQLLGEAALEKTDIDPAQLTPYIEVAGERISTLLESYTRATEMDTPVPGGTIDIPLAVFPKV